VDENTGIVFRKLLGSYTVLTANDAVITCSISSRLRKHLVYPTRDRSSLGYLKVVDVEDIQLVDPVAIGDQVVYVDAGHDTGMITEILPRKSTLTRRAAGAKPLEQVIVANADQIVAVMAVAQPKPNWRLLDRYIASAEASELPTIICLTKLDLAHGRKQEREILDSVDEYAGMGYMVLLTSTTTGEGVDTLRDALAGKLSVFIGKSGVGKTTLLNALQPQLGLRVGAINTQMDKGRHTTTHLEMFALDGGGYLVDTPGMKQFGLWAVEPEDVPMLYRDMAPYVGKCKFGASCTHTHEPECAIKQAITHSNISVRRYESYLYLRDHLYAEE
jgi:ribosome biogenesis GTPase / thiamine phosphate phosphatase